MASLSKLFNNLDENHDLAWVPPVNAGISGAQNDEIQGMECFQGVVAVATATMKTSFHNTAVRSLIAREIVKERIVAHTLNE